MSWLVNNCDLQRSITGIYRDLKYGVRCLGLSVTGIYRDLNYGVRCLGLSITGIYRDLNYGVSYVLACQ